MTSSQVPAKLGNSVKPVPSAEPKGRAPKNVRTAQRKVSSILKEDQKERQRVAEEIQRGKRAEIMDKIREMRIICSQIADTKIPCSVRIDRTDYEILRLIVRADDSLTMTEIVSTALKTFIREYELAANRKG